MKIRLLSSLDVENYSDYLAEVMAKVPVGATVFSEDDEDRECPGVVTRHGSGPDVPHVYVSWKGRTPHKTYVEDLEV